MKTVHLYLVRHGKTWFNQKNITQGWCDSLLLPESEVMARRYATLMSSIPFTKAYTSPTMRARQTAGLIVPGLEPTQKWELMEINYGYLEGESATTLSLFYPDRYDFQNFTGFQGGESWKEAGPRFLKGIHEIIDEASDNEHIFICSHGAIITWFLNTIEPTITSKVDNLSYRHIVCEDGVFHLEDDVALEFIKQTPAIPEKNWLPANHYNILVNNIVVGKCDLRFGHNSQVYYGGNIGYEINEASRGKGYASKAVLKLLEIAKKENMEYLYISCDPANIASKKTIEKAGGQLVEKTNVPETDPLYEKGTTEVLIYKFTL